MLRAATVFVAAQDDDDEGLVAAPDAVQIDDGGELGAGSTFAAASGGQCRYYKHYCLSDNVLYVRR